ncbi:hypothetical protein Pan161_24380 [Gimesia algae]|uniref:Uncharacterized protein n=1 Tax=Gimesia algae TaxID=2527971 RepID=A0A517VCP9_9PLAN|nr:hypothetical protein Pan161_24380 [Gimesia algae]
MNYTSVRNRRLIEFDALKFGKSCLEYCEVIVGNGGLIEYQFIDVFKISRNLQRRINASIHTYATKINCVNDLESDKKGVRNLKFKVPDTFLCLTPFYA